MASEATALRWMKQIPGETLESFMTQFNTAVRSVYQGVLTAEENMHIWAVYSRSFLMVKPTPYKRGIHLFFNAL